MGGGVGKKPLKNGGRGKHQERAAVVVVVVRGARENPSHFGV